MWICPYANGHIQAVGNDVAGRRQYLYHQRWQDDRTERFLMCRDGSGWVDGHAEALGNTPAVARGSYVDPRVIAGYESELTIAAAARRTVRRRNVVTRQTILDKATRTLIQRVAKG